jgi:sugar phosphate isomerase/epimerase
MIEKFINYTCLVKSLDTRQIYFYLKAELSNHHNMKTLKGPGIFLAQFAGDHAPFNSLKSICEWSKSLGFEGVQIPTWDARLIDLKKAAESKTYADEIKGLVEECGLEITELSTHLQGQLVAVNPAYDTLFDGFAPADYHNNPKDRQEWAVQQLKYAARASSNMGLKAHATFSGSLLWHTVYPWPQRPAGLVDDGFTELARRWTPILDTFDEHGVDVCYEIHPGEDIHDGITYEMFLDKVNNHKRACILYDPSHFLLQCMDYLSFIDHYHDRIRMFHVKDAEFNPSGKQGVYGGYQNWVDRAGRFRSLGDGQVDFKAIFSKLAAYDFDGWAVMEWECAMKHPVDGATEGAVFIKDHIIRVTDKAFDDFASAGSDTELNRKLLGL